MAYQSKRLSRCLEFMQDCLAEITHPTFGMTRRCQQAKSEILSNEVNAFLDEYFIDIQRRVGRGELKIAVLEMIHYGRNISAQIVMCSRLHENSLWAH